MTEPRTGPGSEPGQPGSGAMGTGAAGSGNTGMSGNTGTSGNAGMGGNAGAGSSGTGSSGTGSTGAGSSGRPEDGGVTTASRTAAQPNVPRQYGHESGRGDYGWEPERDMASGRDSIIASTAGRSWPAVLLGGLGMLAVGVILLVWPHETLNVVAVLIGAAIVAAGVVRLWEGFTARGGESGGMRAAYVVIGLLAIVVGVYLIRHHALSLFFLAFLTGLFFIVHGVSDLGVAVSAPKGTPGRGSRAVLGVFGLAAGILMIVWPSITLVLLFLIVAAWLLFYGLVLCFLAFRLRKAGKDAEKRTASRMPSSQPAAAGAR